MFWFARRRPRTLVRVRPPPCVFISIENLRGLNSAAFSFIIVPVVIVVVVVAIVLQSPASELKAYPVDKAAVVGIIQRRNRRHDLPGVALQLGGREFSSSYS